MEKKNIEELITDTENTLSQVIIFLEGRQFSSSERDHLVSIGYIGIQDQETANVMIEDFVQTIFIAPIMELFAHESYMNMKHLSQLTFEEYQEYFVKITRTMSDTTPQVQRIFKRKVVEIFEDFERNL